MKNIRFSFLIFLLCNMKGGAQNLFANPGFETINLCTEFKAYCAPEAWFNIPATNILVNSRIAPTPYAGEMVLIVPVGNVMTNFNKPRYTYTALCCPLSPDKKYNLSFFINTGPIEFNQLGIYFTEQGSLMNIAAKLPDSPSIIITAKQLGATINNGWKKVTCTYTATGKEKFFLFTTKGLPAVKYKMTDAMNKSGDVLYFIDDISLQSEEPEPLCPGYEKTIEKLFSYNYRHTDNYPVFADEKPAVPAVKFINDTVVIPGLLFDVNKSNIKPPVAKILDSLAVVLQQRNFIQVTIIGHTDSTGNESNNLLLSEARAASVQQYLIEKMPVTAQKISAAGKASAMPVADNRTAAGRQLNRRVEIIITYWNKQ